MDPETQSRWTITCRDDTNRLLVLNIEITGHGLIRIIPPLVATTCWDPEQIDPLLHALIEARAAAIRRRASN